MFVNSGTDFPPIIEGLAEAEAHGVDVPLSIVVPHEHVAMSMAHGHFFATGRAAGGDPAHQRRARQRRDRGDQRRDRSRADDPDVGSHARRPRRGRFGSRTVPIGWGQEMRDQAALVREACKWDYEVRFPEQVPELLDRAYAIADVAHPRARSTSSLPREVLCEPCPAEALDRAAHDGAGVDRAPRPDQLAARGRAARRRASGR